MELEALVYDRDEDRGPQVGAAVLAAQARPDAGLPPLRVSSTTSSAVLQRVLASDGADILVMVLDDAPGGLDGVELLVRLLPRRTRVQVIYIDVSGTHTTSAYRTPHVYLLPWPCDTSDLAEALRHACENHERWTEHPLILRAGGGARSVLPSEIAFVESDRRRLRLHLRGEVLETYGKLSEVARKLPSSFVQSHKSFLVNLAFVRELRADSLVLTTGEVVPMSQKRRKATREAFRAYVGRVL